MGIFLTILAIIVLSFLLHIIIKQSYNFIFMFSKKPVIWIVFMVVLSFFVLFVGSRIENSINIVALSFVLSLISSIPPKAKEDSVLDQKSIDKITDASYDAMGIKRGRLKYRLGLTAYLIGGVVGWLIYYSQILV